MPCKLAGGRVEVHGHKILYVGGCAEASLSDVVWAYDVEADVWESFARMSGWALSLRARPDGARRRVASAGGRGRFLGRGCAWGRERLLRARGPAPLREVRVFRRRVSAAVANL